MEICLNREVQAYTLKLLEVPFLKNNPKIFYALIIFAVIAAIASIYFSRGYLKTVVSYGILKGINSNINGKLTLKDYKITFRPRNLLIQCKEVYLKDLDGNIILYSKNFLTAVNFRSLFTNTIQINKIKADDLIVNAIREKNLTWNFEKLVQKKKRRLTYKFNEVDLSKIKINLEDKFNDNHVGYENLQLKFKKDNHKHKYLVNINSGLQKPSNNIFVSGEIIAKEVSQFLDGKNNIKIDITNLDSTSLNFFISLLTLQKDSFIRSLSRKYIKDTKLNLQATLISPQIKEHNFNIVLGLSQIAQIPELKLQAQGKLDQNLLIKKANLTFQNTNLELTGSINQYLTKNTPLNLEVKFYNFSLHDLATRFPELNYIVPNFILEMLRFLRGDDYLNGSLHIGGNNIKPELQSKIKLGDNKELKSIIHYTKEKILIKEFELPLEFSNIKIQGEFSAKNSTYDIHLVASDLPLHKLKGLVKDIPALKAYKPYLNDSSIDGYSTVDLNITRNQINQIFKTQIKGLLKLAKLNFVSQSYPLSFRNVNVDLKINSPEILVEQLEAQVSTANSNLASSTYVEARGKLNLDDPSLADIEIGSPRINANTLIQSKVLELLNPKLKGLSASGFVKNFYLQFKKIDQNQKLEIVTRFDLDGINVLTQDDHKFLNIHGNVDLRNEKVKFNNVSFSMNEKSYMALSGTINEDLSEAKLKIKAQELELKELISILDSKHQSKIIPQSGTINCDLEFKNKDIFGNVVLNNLGFIYDSKYLTKAFSNLTGNLSIDKDIVIETIKGKYGQSNIHSIIGRIKNYKNQDARYIDLNLDLDLFFNEINNLIPSSIRSILSIDGVVPLKIHFTGDKLKQNYDVELLFNKVKSFLFSNWFLYNNKIDAKILGKITVTPQLISSNNLAIVFDSKNTDLPLQTKLNSSFQVEDYKQASKLNYYVRFETPKTPTINDLSLLEPHVISLKPLNLKIGSGYFNCDTFGNAVNRQTICNFDINSATAQKYGIGDLNASKIQVDLLSVAYKPLDVNVKLSQGDWNTIPYNNLKFDLLANGDFVYINDLKAKVKDGTARGKTSFNIKTLESTFKLQGENLPAHEITQGIWGLGAEVPEGVVDGTFEGKTVGVLPEPMFFNLTGTANLICKNGKLSTLRTMQKILTAVNTLNNFDINNITQILVTYKGGSFDHIITSLDYDHGKISSKKVLLKAPQIELNLSGYIDYAKDQQWIKGLGLVPKRSKSILQGVGIGKVNLGNLVSLSDIGEEGSKEKREFEFTMIGPVYDTEKAAESLKSSFHWL